MWFIFPQLAGLGFSSPARYYAIGSRGEGLAYLAHPVLGRRLLQCTDAVLALQERSAEEIFGSVDALKFRSCMTLFAALSAADSAFHRALDRYCRGAADERTLALLESLP